MSPDHRPCCDFGAGIYCKTSCWSRFSFLFSSERPQSKQLKRKNISTRSTCIPSPVSRLTRTSTRAFQRATRVCLAAARALVCTARSQPACADQRCWRAKLARVCRALCARVVNVCGCRCRKRRRAPVRGRTLVLTRNLLQNSGSGRRLQRHTCVVLASL